MREFENIAYVDLQKTGTTTIVAVLKEFLDETEVHKGVHGPVPRHFDRNKVCFISVRDPLSLYISLFNFAASHNRGGLYGVLRKKGLDRLYRPSVEAFEEWLDFMLDPGNADAINEKYAGTTAFDDVGFLSVRLLYTSLPRFRRLSKKQRLSSRDEIREFCGTRLVFQDYVRTESLGSDLFAFLSANADRVRLRRSLVSMKGFVAAMPRKNVSRKVPELVAENISARLRQRVREREWIFEEMFGYGAVAGGRPPKCVVEKMDRTQRPA